MTDLIPFAGTHPRALAVAAHAEDETPWNATVRAVCHPDIPTHQAAWLYSELIDWAGHLTDAENDPQQAVYTVLMCEDAIRSELFKLATGQVPCAACVARGLTVSRIRPAATCVHARGHLVERVA